MDNLDYAWQALHQSEGHVFLTGNAGTGKSTLIKKFVKANEGEVIVLAPTGVAAINIGGQTIHSFFHFPARPISYNAVKFLNPNDPNDYAKIKMIKRAKYFVIDEISMVRADMMDQIAWFFYKNFGDKPFGGKKIIMVGDLDQLPPVVATEQEKEMLFKRYTSEFFFSASVWSKEKNYTKFSTIVLTKVWRQTDTNFIDLLNKIKNNMIAPFEIDRLNHACLKESNLSPEDGIMLCTTNNIANEVNSEMIARLPGDVISLTGTIVGDFDKKNCTVEPIIHLKIGCRIMTMRNGIGYANGSIGVLKEIDSNGDLVIKLNGVDVVISKYTFEAIKYDYDKTQDRITCQPTGKFIQYPVKVAYAMTVHKSQGQTFDKIIIDLGERGAFAHGQVYVALSRCTSMEGVTLRRPITGKDLIYNQNVLDFKKLA